MLFKMPTETAHEIGIGTLKILLGSKFTQNLAGRPFIEHYSKQENAGWDKTEIEGLDAVLKLDSVECEIALVELYDLAEFSAI